MKYFCSIISYFRQQPEQFSQALNSLTSSTQTQFSQYGQCGRRNAHGINGRINNPAQKYAEGDTEFGEYPWQVALLKKEQYDNVYVCGGSLIDGTHLLTAAHCIKQYRPEELRVRLGEWDVNNDSEFFPNIEFDVLDMKVDLDQTFNIFRRESDSRDSVVRPSVTTSVHNTLSSDFNHQLTLVIN